MGVLEFDYGEVSKKVNCVELSFLESSLLPYDDLGQHTLIVGIILQLNIAQYRPILDERHRDSVKLIGIPNVVNGGIVDLEVTICLACHILERILKIVSGPAAEH